VSPHSDRWLAALWPIVRRALPPAPARVVELGCGPLGGVVPMLRADGYDAVGVDPQAPDEPPHYVHAGFEKAELPADVDAVVASLALHHVADPAEVLDRVARLLGPRGTLVVVEWDWPAFDEASATWCFDRLDPDGEPGWLHRRRNAWIESGQPWHVYFPEWARSHGLHDTGTLLQLLDDSFERLRLDRGAYFFPELVETTEDDELAAIRSGWIRAARVDYVGRPR
jgi:SAM-dependent methyltransferase